MDKCTQPGTIHLSVLGYKDGDEWVAHGLEMDLVAYGPNFESACEELKGLVEAQISFALFKQDLSLLWQPAPNDLFAAFHKAILDEWTEDTDGGQPQVTGSFDVPPAYVISQVGSDYAPVDA